MYKSVSSNNERKHTIQKMNSSSLLQHLLDQSKQYEKTILKVCVLKIRSTSLLTGEIQVKTTVRYHFKPTKVAVIKQMVTSTGEDVHLELSCVVDMNVEMVQQLWKMVWQFLKRLNVELLCDLAIPRD